MRRSNRIPYSPESDELVVYTDGALLNNGKGSPARGGYGVWFGENDGRNICGPLPGERQNNQRGELYAILRALESTRNSPRLLVIRSHSKCEMQNIAEWYSTWEENGFLIAYNTPEKNGDLMHSICGLIKERGEKRFQFEHVKVHDSDIGNEGAQRLAAEGTRQPHEQIAKYYHR